MTKITITTDHKWKPFVYRHDVPAKVLADQFEHLHEDDACDGFFSYRGWWYHLSDFLHVGLGSQMPSQCSDAPSLFDGWHGYASDSYFSGVLLEVSSDGESYRVGTYYS